MDSLVKLVIEILNIVGPPLAMGFACLLGLLPTLLPVSVGLFFLVRYLNRRKAQPVYVPYHPPGGNSPRKSPQQHYSPSSNASPNLDHEEDDDDPYWYEKQLTESQNQWEWDQEISEKRGREYDEKHKDD